MPDSEMEHLHYNSGSFKEAQERDKEMGPRRGQLITVFSPQPVPFTGLIEGGLQEGHTITVMGSVLSTGENRYRELLSLSASPLSEPGCCQLRMVHQASSKLPTPSSGDGKSPALPTMLSPPTTYL
ncbi:hypothetical protein FD754_023775 [Muntiacus muntjak]|uniref:Galectin n=1 Tax=Muntiacus muntjak TaxID=9888 RepID=A0A5N3USE6_MUNMU|nr:hypothetical protein FD754_023775 [Muntiacus muntjak]